MEIHKFPKLILILSFWHWATCLHECLHSCYLHQTISLLFTWKICRCHRKLKDSSSGICFNVVVIEGWFQKVHYSKKSVKSWILLATKPKSFQSCGILRYLAKKKLSIVPPGLQLLAVMMAWHFFSFLP